MDYCTDIDMYAQSENLLEQLLRLPVNKIKLIIDSLEAYADLFVDDQNCEEHFKLLPENIFKVMVRLRFFEHHQRTIDVVKIADFYDRLKQAQCKNDGMYDLSELNLPTLDGFLDILVLSNEAHPVKDLTLWWNNLKGLSPSLKLLPSLRLLDVMGNEIRVIPNWINDLKKIERLNVAQNQISELPDSIGRLEYLTGLYLSGNYISELPETLGDLSNLRGLYIKGCPISQFPCSFGNLTRLEIVCCAKFLRERLPHHIRQQLKVVSQDLKDGFERKGHRFIGFDRRTEAIVVRSDEIPAAYQIYLMDQ